jgi:hypothetical protein
VLFPLANFCQSDFVLSIEERKAFLLQEEWTQIDQKNRLEMAQSTGQRIVIDCSYDKIMSDKVDLPSSVISHMAIITLLGNKQLVQTDQILLWHAQANGPSICHDHFQLRAWFAHRDSLAALRMCALESSRRGTTHKRNLFHRGKLNVVRHRCTKFAKMNMCRNLFSCRRMPRRFSKR